MPQFYDDDDRIRFFFEEPTRSPSEHARDKAHSVLYLLRRELIETIGYDANVSSEADVDVGGSRNRLFASLLLMSTMVDLLAKFMFGDEGGVGDRFRRFVRSAGGGGKPRLDAELLWSTRNSLVHAFGLPETKNLAKARVTAIGIGQRKEVTWRGSSGLIVIEREGETAIIYVDGLFRTVAESIHRYQRTLFGSGSAPARATFADAFARYGWIFVGVRKDEA